MLLGIDVGTTHTKVGIYHPDGDLVAHVKAPTPRRTDARGRGHYLPEPMWETAAGLIRQAVTESAGEVTALAVSSMGESGISLDAAGNPTSPIIPWDDDRSEPQMRGLVARLPPTRWFEITGLYPNHIHTIAKWAWLREHAPDAWQETRLWLSTMGWVRYRLTGEAVMEASQAARTMAYDIHRHVWATELLELAGVDPGILPPLVHATDQVGEVNRAAAAATGLAPGTPVFAGGHDHICAALACGAITPEVLLDSQGTAEGLTLGLPQPPSVRGTGGFGVGPHVIPGHSYLLGGIYSSGGSVDWVRRLLGVPDFAGLRQLAAEAPPGTAPLFIAHFHGAAPPFNDPGATGAFIEVRPEHGPAHLARAVYEGVVFELRACLEALERLGGHEVSVIRMVGGAAGDPLWSRIRAAILGRPLERARYDDMVTLGDALLAGLGSGLYGSPREALARTYRSRESFVPDRAWQEGYQAIFPHYLDAARALRERRGETEV